MMADSLKLPSTFEKVEKRLIVIDAVDCACGV